MKYICKKITPVYFYKINEIAYISDNVIVEAVKENRDGVLLVPQKGFEFWFPKEYLEECFELYEEKEMNK